MALSFSESDKLKMDLMESQKKEIEALYKSWSDDLAKKAKKYAASPAPSSELAEKQTKILMKQVEATGKQISNEVYGKIRHNMYVVSNEVVENNKSWLHSLGFEDKGINVAFGSVPDTVVRNLVTGRIYESGWSLNKRIWGSNEETMKDAYGIVAKGLAENSPISEIAKELSRLVDPSAAKPWNPVVAMKNTKTGKIEYKRIYGRKVDYNAQRLARTLVQHSYQQSVIAVTENNPLIENYIWHSNGSRVCEICQDRDGRVFKKGDVPMDHPNGMCFIEPVVDKDMVDKLADWFNSPDGTYPELDEFAKEFGYEAGHNKPVMPDLMSNYNLSKQTISLLGGKNDPELTDSIRDYFLPDDVRNNLDNVEKLRTYSDFESYFASKGIKLDTDLVTLKKERRDDEIEAVQELCQKLVVGTQTFESTFGPDSLRKLNRIVLYDNELNVTAAYHFNMVGEDDPFAGTIRFRDWSADGRTVFHELAHAFQDSNALPGEDAVLFASRMVKEADLPEGFKAYSGADQDVMDAERMADAFGFGFGRGSDVGIEFIKRVGGVVK